MLNWFLDTVLPRVALGCSWLLLLLPLLEILGGAVVVATSFESLGLGSLVAHGRGSIGVSWEQGGESGGF